ncbi:MAG TPA: hypothetical protein VF668_11200 [Pyrinomonadaceae bacterium]|jgi:hypothetical protein
MTKTAHKLNRPSLTAAALTLLAACLLGPGRASAQWATTGSDVSNTNAGNVGVGTGAATPTNKLTVSNGSAAGNDVFALFGNVTPGSGQIGMQFGRSGATGGSAIIQGVKEGLGANAVSLQPSGGRVGIGTASPEDGLHVHNSFGMQSIKVSGSGAAVVNFLDSAAASNQRLYQWRSEGGLFRMSLVGDTNGSYVRQNILVANSSGHVGLGTSAPASILSVNLDNANYTNAGGAGAHFVMTNPNATGQNVVASIINGVTVAKWRTDFAGNISWVAGPTGGHDFYTGGDYGTGAVRLSIKNDGRVGVGTSNPGAAYKLDVAGALNAAGDVTVAGDITAGGSVSAKYQDVAEWVPSTQRLAAGTVVVLDTGRSNHVVASGKAYDTGVAGVVSAEPGVILGVAGEGKLKVATTGRVRVRVDATRGAIKVGDLLVTSEVEGVAMKSVPVELGGVSLHRPGTIVGKALEPLAGGVGEILVLLSLQ